MRHFVNPDIFEERPGNSPGFYFTTLKHTIMKFDQMQHLKKHQTSVDEISSIIATTIIEKTFLNHDDLKLTIKTLIKTYRIKMMHHDWHRIVKPTENQKLQRALYIKTYEVNFYRKAIRNLTNDNNYLDELQIKLENEIKNL